MSLPLLLLLLPLLLLLLPPLHERLHRTCGLLLSMLLQHMHLRVGEGNEVHLREALVTANTDALHGGRTILSAVHHGLGGNEGND